MSATQKNKYVGGPFVKKINETRKKWWGNDTKQPKMVSKRSHQTDDESDSLQSEKLRIVINSFDKILDEYGSLSPTNRSVQDSTDFLPSQSEEFSPNLALPLSQSTPKQAPVPKSATKIPKLLKAKTCSIIESKCILKKTISNPGASTSSTDDKLAMKTKSLTDVSVTEHKQFQPQSTIKVKDLVRRINSLTDEAPTLSKAVSNTNLSLSKKHGSISRIPVNATLRKSFPSTPCHLDRLDGSGGANGSAISKAKSIQNLTKPRLSLHKPVDLDRRTATAVALKPNNTNTIRNKEPAKPCGKTTRPLKNVPAKAKQDLAVKVNAMGKRAESAPVRKGSLGGAGPKEAPKPTKPESKDQSNSKVLRNQTFKKSNIKTTVKADARQCSPVRIKLDLKKTQAFLEKVSPMDADKFYLDPDDFVGDKVQGTSVDKKLDYNSDDSGNISNDIDCDEINSTSSVRSRVSSDSLSTVLDVCSTAGSSDAGVELCEKDSTKEIFFRTGVISHLEAQRDERLAGVVIALQAHCRGYLARKRLQKKKLEDLAVRCIQRNVRKFMLVRDWPWWRLLVRVTPLLNVHRTEQELRTKTEELEALKLKLQKIENERTSLQHETDKLEAKLSEMTVDLAEEHSTATLAAERLDAETSERLRLERELSETKHKNKELAQASERLEMELLYARSDLNGICEEEDDGDSDGVYKQRYERVLRELEFTKRRLQQQHEDDLEQLVGLKKQLEKKLADAYEEVEEQRQVVGQWKRKVQKLNGEMNDLKLLLEEQSSRNNLLEKKQRKYDSETSLLQEELKKERQAKDRLAREKEVLVAEKYAIESTLADTRLELDLKEERLGSLQREFDEITCGGKTEEEVTVLRKQKIDCERRLQDQDEELDELAGQVQLLEQAKLRLEMTLESMRKEAKREAQLREEELEEARCNAQKKVKALEQQLENEHEERTQLLRERHELERRLQAAADAERTDRAGDEALLQRLKRDLKRTKALLRDTQAQLERQKAETPSKNLIRQLRNQLEDLECARALAVKTKQSLEGELLETQAQLEEANKQKLEAEERGQAMQREKSELQSQLEENEEELAEVLKKYKAAVQQMSVDQATLQEQVSLVAELEVERNHLKEQLAELTSRLESAESMGGASSNLLFKRSELKVKELESKLELEQTTRSRLETQITRLKETVDKLQSDAASSRVKEQQAQDQLRKLQRQLREVKEELNKSLAKESEVIIKKKELEKRCEALEAEASTTRTDLRLALKRIEDLQSAIQGELEDSISDNSDSDGESFGSDESVNTFLVNHKLGSPKNEKKSLSNDARRLSNTSRSSTSSNLGRETSYA
ncbi:unconventional myosin-XVIIIa isoform X2 [Cylas formicarius]|uniref:unconventional myosin-XVIIIa isoform X2 n=1 Tax=Cylas formicarius TaxID=197179 RepID=UPI002958C533|nr:unconventional myosin-XVIIIa isoform X2 [Cylas formicarius]XP_060534265.1 unconventional myosin-XVIIIa isoform X2 [Cylas formicarius]